MHETTDHETSATLEEVLAFIDACDADKRKRSPAQTRKVRSQVGHEIKRLRREAKYLEMRLQHLTGGSESDNETTHQANQAQRKWMQTVLEEYRLHRQSKRANKQLKALVAKQNQVLKRLPTFGSACF